jgi:undecaprenol kinase
MTLRPDDQYNAYPVNRDAYRPVANTDRVASFRHSVAGLWYLLRHEQSAHLLAVYSAVVVGVALWLQVDILLFVLVLIPVGITWVVECLNTAIEAAVDLVMPDLHPLAKIAKDLGSTATFLSASLSLIISLLLLAPPLFERLTG